MKTINASVVPGSVASDFLSARRWYGHFDAASVKREERRASRRALNRQLACSVYPGVENDFGAPIERAPVNVIKGIQFPLEFLAKTVTDTRSVTVVRKRVGYKRVVETLRVAA